MGYLLICDDYLKPLHFELIINRMNPGNAFLSADTDILEKIHMIYDWHFRYKIKSDNKIATKIGISSFYPFENIYLYKPYKFIPDMIKMLGNYQTIEKYDNSRACYLLNTR